MGGLLSSFYKYFFINGKEFRMMMVGLDGAGKTTALNQLKLGEYTQTVPTVGFNLEKVKYEGLEFNLWDLGGQEKLRPLWMYYTIDNDAVIYIIDAADSERLQLAYTELHKLFGIKSIRSVPYIILLNKQDLPNAVKTEQVERDVKALFEGRLDFEVIECIAKDPEDPGLVKALNSVYTKMLNRELAKLSFF